MKLTKIKHIKDNKNVIKWLINLLITSESSYSPLIEEINHPTNNFYILLINKMNLIID